MLIYCLVIIQDLNLFFKVTLIKYSTFLNIKSNKAPYYNKISNLGKLYFSSNSDLDKDLKFNLENLDPNWIKGFSDA